MSVAEMKQKAIALIDKVENEKKLEQVLQVLSDTELRPTIEEIFEKAKAQYGDTLQRLAQ